jgi:membrane-associated HD superfamily phosphohydrolase
VITDYLATEKEKRKFVDQIGLAYTEAIEGNIENAKKICDKVIQRIELYKSNIGRFYYLLSCLSVVGIALIISYFLKRYAFIPEIIPHFYMMTYASIGGFLSVARDIKKIQIESSEFGWFQFFYGGIRILTAMLSGLIVYILIQSDLVLPMLNDGDNSYTIAIIAFLSGFSETFLPNLLKQIDNKEPATKDQPEPGDHNKRTFFI